METVVDAQLVINLGASAVLAVASWFTRSVMQANKELAADLAHLREDIPKTYVTKGDYRIDMREIKDLLVSISDKLDRKADK